MILNNFPIHELNLTLTASADAPKGYAILSKDHAPIPYSVARLSIHWPKDPTQPIANNLFTILVWVTEVSVINNSMAKAVIQEHKGALDRRVLLKNMNIVDPITYLYSDLDPEDPYQGLHRLINPVKDYRTESGTPDFLDVLDFLSIDYVSEDEPRFLSFRDIDPNYRLSRKPTTLKNKISFDIFDPTTDPYLEDEELIYEEEKPPFIPVELRWLGKSCREALGELLKFYPCRILDNDITQSDKIETTYQWRRRRKFKERFFQRRLAGNYSTNLLRDDEETTILFQHIRNVLTPYQYFRSTSFELEINNLEGKEPGITPSEITRLGSGNSEYGYLIFPYYYYSSINASMTVVREQTYDYLKSSHVNWNKQYEINVDPFDFGWYYGEDWDTAQLNYNSNSSKVTLRHEPRLNIYPEIDSTFSRTVEFVGTNYTHPTAGFVIDNLRSLEDGYVYPVDAYIPDNDRDGNTAPKGNGILSLRGNVFDYVNRPNNSLTYGGGGFTSYNTVVTKTQNATITCGGYKVSGLTLKTIRSTTTAPEMPLEIKSTHPDTVFIWELVNPEVATSYQEKLRTKYEDLSPSPTIPTLMLGNQFPFTLNMSALGQSGNIVYRLKDPESGTLFDHIYNYLRDLIDGPEDDEEYISPVPLNIPTSDSLLREFVRQYLVKYTIISVRPQLLITHAGPIIATTSQIEVGDIVKTGDVIPLENPGGVLNFIANKITDYGNHIQQATLPTSPSNVLLQDPLVTYSNRVDFPPGVTTDYEISFSIFPVPPTTIPSVVPFEIQKLIINRVYYSLFQGTRWYVGVQTEWLIPTIE